MRERGRRAEREKERERERAGAALSRWNSKQTGQQSKSQTDTVLKRDSQTHTDVQQSTGKGRQGGQAGRRTGLEPNRLGTQ